MHALALSLLLPILSDLTFAQLHRNHARPHRLGKRTVEKVIEIEDIVWTTVTLDGPAPTGWHHSDHADKEQKTLSSWMTSIPDGAAPTQLQVLKVSKDGAIGSEPGHDSKHSTTDSSAGGITHTIHSTSTQHIPAGSASDAGASNPSAVSSASSSSAPTIPISPASGGEKKAVEKPASSSPLSYTSPASAGESPPSSPTTAVNSAETSATSSAASPSKPTSTGKYPFSAVVAFGDNLSDNGNGSYAHHVADKDNPNNAIYGARTWTNAQVAVSFLTDLLGVPMDQDFAFGHAWGGADAGATLDNTMYVSDFHNATVAAELGCPGAPPASLQVSNYISGGVNKEALHFLWIGNNDADMVGFYQQDAFNKNLTTGMTKVVKQLLDAGAPYVFVPNIYPKQLAPVVPKYYGWTAKSDQDAFGTFINNANAAMKTALAGLGDKVIYYDANSFLTEVWNNAGSYGITNAKDTNGMPAFCDGDPDQTSAVQAAIAAGTISSTDKNNWGICVDDHKQDEWYWMQYLDMTSHVHELLAGDMNKAITAHFT